MFKKLVLVSAVVMLSACSTIGDKRVEGPESVTAEFLGGEVKVTFTKDGQFESLQANGAARVTSNLPTAIEEAFILANLRAKQKVVEFMKNEVEGNKLANTVFDSLQKGSSVNGLPNAEVNSKISYEVQENIKSKSKAILQGVSVESKKFDTATNTVLVTVRTSSKEIDAARKVRALMGN